MRMSCRAASVAKMSVRKMWRASTPWNIGMKIVLIYSLAPEDGVKRVYAALVREAIRVSDILLHDCPPLFPIGLGVGEIEREVLLELGVGVRDADGPAIYERLVVDIFE